MKAKKILILSSNPYNDLKLNREIEDLKNIIKRAQDDSQFEIEFVLEVQTEKLQDLFIDYQPRIVHFCGHGKGEQGLVLQNKEGYAQSVTTEALSNLLGFFDDKVECVVLNACYSEVQANTIVQHINYAIGMSHEIRDDAAIAFATGFYRWLSHGKSIEDSYKFGRNAIQLQINGSDHSRFRNAQVSGDLVTINHPKSEVVPEHEKPILKKKSPLTVFSEKVTSTTSNNESNKPKNSEPTPEQLELEKLQQAIAKETKYKQYRDRARDTWDDFGQKVVVRQPLSQHEYRQRKTLLSKVKDFWIEGFLKPSVYGNNTINLDWKNSLNAIFRPFEAVEDIPVELDESFDELQTTDILNQTGLGKTLLILGEPGSGKTIALLQLAKKLIAQTEQDLTKPIPVVFNLSSWGQKQQPIEKWLIEELKDKYQVPQTLSEPWIQQQQLILLLDGLDEVEAKKRDACVRALNQFIATHNITEMVVCSRVKDYEALTERLQLSSAVSIKPLSQEKLYEFLDQVGDSLAGLKTLLQQDRELEQFAQTPLILNIMSVAYQGWSVKDFLQQFRSSKEHRQHLFNAYIERMFKYKGVNQQYPKDRAIYWLTWLAKRISQGSQSVFLIEQMQPNWLQSNLEKRLYQIATILMGILVILSILLLGGALDLHNDKINLFKVLTINGVMWGLVLWCNFGRNTAEIKTFETLTYPWKKTRKDLLDGLTDGLSWSRILSPIGIVWCYLTWKEPRDYLKIIVFGLILGLILGLIIGLIRGLRGSEIETKTIPNQGIWRSARNAVIIVLVSWLILSAIILFPSPMGLFPQGLKSITSVISWGLILGLLFGGGIACIQHLSLRLILYLKGCIPRNYARFLDYASERLLIKKVGGGYIFYHRMLLEHFAQRHHSVTSRHSQPVAQSQIITKVRSRKIKSTAPQSSKLIPNQIVCHNCNHQNLTHNKFCTKCGTDLDLSSRHC